MADKKITFGLSVQSIEQAIKQLEEYKLSLQAKVDEIIQRLGEVGLETVNSIMQSVPEEVQGDYSVFVEPIANGEDMSGVAITLSGSQVAFIEFSSGVRFGTQYYPLPSGAPFGAGTYPFAEPKPDGTYNWSSPYGWWYKDDATGEYKHTYGNRAYMPMYHAEEAIIMEVSRIVKEVFG